MAVLRTSRKTLNALLRPTGFQLVRPRERAHIIPFQPFKKTLGEASKAGLSVGDYIDRKFHVPGATQKTIDDLAALGILNKDMQTICEVGPGSGRYLEKVQRLCAPRSYQIYETDPEWADWLAQTYRLTAHPADGTTLRDTATGSVDLVHAHKVFVYLPFVVTCQYLIEMIRVARNQGTIVFDIVTENCMPDETIQKWIAGKIYYPCLMSRSLVIDLFTRRQCSLRGSFFAPMMPGQSEYLAFTKNGV
jgi:hypothetical protein